jgi:hypothetical protein
MSFWEWCIVQNPANVYKEGSFILHINVLLFQELFITQHIS